MEFKPASQNGVIPPDQLYTRPTPHLMVATSSSAYWSAGLTVKVINTAPYPKTIPVSIQSQFTPTGSTSSSTVTVGEGYFDGATATIFLTNLGTGTNLLSAHWPGESRYQGFDYTMTTAINILPGVPLSGGLNLSVSPTNYYGEPVNLTLTSYNTPSLNGTTATITATFQAGSIITTSSAVITFVNNTATYSTQYLSTGTVSYYATWPGRVLSDNRYYITTNSNTTSTQVIKHTLASPILLSITPNPGYITNSTTTATVELYVYSSPHNLNGTTATVYLNGASAYPLTFVNNNTAFTVVTFNSTGTYTVSAIWYGGKLEDNKYYNSITTSSSVTILPPQDIGGEVSFTFNPSSPLKTFTTNLTGTLTSGITINTGTIRFTEGTTVLGTAPVVNNTATISTVFATTGSHTITATWIGQRINGIPYTDKQSTSSITVIDFYSTGVQILGYGVDINPNNTGGADVMPIGNSIPTPVNGYSSPPSISGNYYNNAGWDSTSTSQWIQLSRNDIGIGSTLYVTVVSNGISGQAIPNTTPTLQTINGSFVITGKQGNYYDVEGNWTHSDQYGPRQLWQNVANPLYYIQYNPQLGWWGYHGTINPVPTASITSAIGTVHIN